MSFSMAFFTFLNAWWLALIMVTPFGLDHTGAKTTEFDYEAAPRKINWRKKLVLATLLAMVITAGLAVLIKYDVIPLHEFYKDAP